MPTLGIEMCDADFQAASGDQQNSQCLKVTDADGSADWPGFAYFEGERYQFGRAGEDQWFVHPRRIAHTFWARLTHESSSIGPAGKPVSFSELAFHFFREFITRTRSVSPAADKFVLAVPGTYLKDAATEEEKIGLLLGMVGELKLPLAGIVDMACAALCDSRGAGFNPALPVVVVDIHLDGAELTLVGTEDKLARKDFIYLPQSGYAQLLKHLTSTMGNRFLRHTAFDILEDGRIEQMFFRQTKEFLFNGAAEHRYQINTAARAYEMIGKRAQLTNDAAGFVTTLAQGVQTFVRTSPHATEPCTVALTARASQLPGFEARLRTAGFSRFLRLQAGAAACGAARIGEAGRPAYDDLGDVPVNVVLPLSLARTAVPASWEARLQKLPATGPRPAPTHVILEGIGHAIGNAGRFTIGAGAADLPLPEAFGAADDCSVPLVREHGRLWFVDVAATRDATLPGQPPRTAVEAGDRLTIRCGTASADVLFAHCPPVDGARGHN